jgi:hypothetical protein
MMLVQKVSIAKMLSSTTIIGMNTLTTKQEVALLRSAVAGLVGRDKEGVYQPALVKELLASLSRTPTRTFTTSDDFLNQLAQAK